MPDVTRPRAQSLPFPRKNRGRELIISLALVSFVGLFWAHHYHLFEDVQTWAEPLDYWGDALFTAGVVKACEEGSYVPFVSKMVPTHGAPFVASWNDFPIPEDLIFCGTGYLARVVGLFRAINIGYFSAALLSALSLYWVMRAMRVRWQWAWLAGGLFGLAPFLFHRTVHHYNLLFFWHVPWCVLLSIWAASRYGLPLRSRRFYFGCAVAAVAGFSNPYFLNFFFQILGLSALAGWLRHRARPRKSAVLTWMAIGLGCFLLVNLDTIAYQLKNGPNLSAVARSETDLERFALKPFELIFPQPPHVWPFVDRLATAHNGNIIIHTEHEYMGVASSIAFLATLAAVIGGVLRRKVTRKVDLGLLTVWLMGYAAVGGINAGLGALGVVLFRSSNRASIFIMAISLVVFGMMLTHATRKWRDWVLIAICAVVLPVAAFEQVFPRKTAEEHLAIHAKARGDRELVEFMQSRVPKGSRIFQLPAIDFPEVSFEPFRPFLWSDGLSYSFANMRGRPENDWQHRVGALPPQEMLRELDKEGFQAIFILGNGQGLANAFSAVRRVEYRDSPASGASVILLNP